MKTIENWISDLASDIWSTLTSVRISDILDVLVVALMLYYVYKFIRARRAGKLALGILIYIFILVLSVVLNMHALRFILTNVYQIGLITVIVVFQPELRSALEMLGGESLRSIKSIGEQRGATEIAVMIRKVTEAVTDMADMKAGSLIAIERTTKLGDQIITGTVIDAEVSTHLIKNIFFNKAPLHDGALIIRGTRLYAAGCLLPLSMNTDIIKDLGTRHRAAIGLSENSDAIVIVVSEETGIISTAFEGRLTRNHTSSTLINELESCLIDEHSGMGKRGIRKLRVTAGHNEKNSRGAARR